MSNNLKLLAFASVTAMAAAMWSVPAAAQDAATAATGAEATAAAGEATEVPAADAPAADNGDIVVTARKRSESLQDVPLSIAAVSGELMQQQGIKKLDDLQFKVPNFTMTETGIGSNIAIRGIFSGVNQGFEQSVGTYIDGIHYGRAQQARSPFLDVERVEVLRGPQSILFGKNSIAGALNIISAQPTHDFEGYAQASYQPDGNDWEMLGAVSGPLSDRLRARVAARYHKGDGYIDNLTLDRSEPQRKDWNLRGIVEWDATDNLTINLKAEHGEFDVEGRNIEIYNELPSISTKPLFAGRTYAQILRLLGADESVLNTVKDGKRSANGDTSDNKSNTYVVTANWETDIGTVTSISGLNKFSYNELCDCDFTGATILTVDLREKYEQFSQEIRLASDTKGKLDYIVGGFFQTSDHSYRDNINIPTNSLLVPVINAQAAGFGTLTGGTRAAREAKVEAKILSAFAQLNYDITDQFRVTVGGRVTHEEKEGDRTLTIQTLAGGDLAGMQAVVAPLVYAQLLNISSTNLATIAGATPAPPGVTCTTPPTGVTPPQRAAACLAQFGAHPVEGKVSKTGFVPSLTVQYDVNDDVMLYASATKGTKSGGFDFRGNNRGFYPTMEDAFEFSEEKATSFEAGAKTQFLDHRGTFNVAFYHTKIKNLQVSVFDGKLGYVVGNADARTQGIEVDGRFRVTPELTLRGSGALTDFEFTDYPNGQCYPGQASDGTLGQCDYEGKTNQLVADWQATLAIDWAHQLTDWLELRTTADMFATDGYFLAPTLDPNQVQGSYAKFNMRVALGAPDNRWEIALLGKNLTDKHVVSMGVTTPLSYSTFGAYSQANIVGEGRTFAVQGRLNF
ncbi:TonB-dependent receptor [Sphingomonas sp. RB56-2]|uniref:TonB-dependent receptor n=1 Tax=Sphingomonas brevis TaxID=2908206 RepID=A0ABT0S9H1_9SPHN|nr:TonB-dependent receptor [Sphingomonas brevis]MCL6741056.1 TonB-dependent receptor [Sphingomonas brevis]